MKDKPYEKSHSRPYRGRNEKPGYHRNEKPRTHREEKPETYDRQNEGEVEGGSTQIVAGRNAVLELIRSGATVDKLYVRKDGDRSGSISLIVAEALKRSIPVVEVEPGKLDLMAGGVTHQGAVASCAAKEYCSVDDLLAIAEEKGEKPFLVMADGIEDPQNLGALIRVCECAGVHGLILPKRHAVGLTEAVAKASAGALAHLAVAKVVNLAQTVEELKEKGVWVFAAEAGGDDYDATDMTCPALIIMGSEGFGVSRLLREKSDYQVSIPMAGLVNSLNVSTAAAVIIHEAARQRRKAR